MTWYYSEMSNRKIIHDILFSDQRHIYINRQSYWEAVDVGNKVISQNNIQKIANIVILQRVLFIKLVSQCKTEEISKSLQVTYQCKAATYNTVQK